MYMYISFLRALCFPLSNSLPHRWRPWLATNLHHSFLLHSLLMLEYTESHQNDTFHGSQDQRGADCVCLRPSEVVGLRSLACHSVRTVRGRGARPCICFKTIQQHFLRATHTTLLASKLHPAVDCLVIKLLPHCEPARTKETHSLLVVGE